MIVTVAEKDESKLRRNYAKRRSIANFDPKAIDIPLTAVSTAGESRYSYLAILACEIIKLWYSRLYTTITSCVFLCHVSLLV